MHSKKPKFSFKDIVQDTPDIATGYHPGLRALGQHKSKIQLTQTNLCQGSVDIDSNVAKRYPNENRWDYAISYNSKVFFVEVHSANTSEVTVVIKKLEWLKKWLHENAETLNKHRVTSRNPFIWIQSNGFHILKNSPQYRKAAIEGILPISILILK